MNENKAGVIAPEKRISSTDADAARASGPGPGTPKVERAGSRIAPASPAAGDQGVGCVKRSEILIERLRSIAKEGGFAHRPAAARKPAVRMPGLKKGPSVAIRSPIGSSQSVAPRRNDVRTSSARAAVDRVLRRDPAGGVRAPEETPVEGLAGVSNAMRILNVAASAFPLVPPEQVTGAQLARYARLIYEKTGIQVSPQKRMLLSNRLRRRLRQTGISDFDAYYRHLQGLSSDNSEWNEFFQEITTHETYLFRDENQWDWFANVYLPDWMSQRRVRRGSGRMRFWSAACSTGDEVYTIACCIAANLPNPKDWTVEILGTDIAVGEIRRAEHPAFSQRAMRLVPKECLRYFDWDEGSETWSPKPVLRQMVRFRPHNLMTPLADQPFDVVFLKNVLIYFDRDSKRQVLQNVCPLVRPGGLLVAGAAEGVASLVSGFRRVEPWLFERLEG